MAIGTEIVAAKYLNVQAGVPVAVNFPAYEVSDVFVYYGKNSLLAAVSVDYTVTLGNDFNTFSVTPTATLIGKINALIAADATEVNYITVRRSLDYTTDVTGDLCRNTQFTSREFERAVMRFQQLGERLNRAIVMAENVVGTDAQLTLGAVEPGRALIVSDDGTKILAGPTAADIANAQDVLDDVTGLYGQTVVQAGNAANSATAASNSAAAAAAAVANLPTFSAFGADLVNDADAATARATLGAAASGAVGSSGLTMATARLLGRTTAGTGAVEAVTVGAGLALASGTLSVTASGGGVIVDRAYAEYTANADITAAIPQDDTIPQNTEGTQILSATITPKSATNRLRVRFRGQISTNPAASPISAIFVNSEANARDATWATNALATGGLILMQEFEYTPGATAAQTISVRVSAQAGQSVRLNGNNSSRFFGGTSKATLVIEEIAA